MENFMSYFDIVSTTSQLPMDVILVRVVVAFVLGLIICGVTYLTYSNTKFDKSVLHSKLIITVVSAMIINVIGDNIARAFGLWGALSFIRFRTTLRDTKDTAIFFYSVATGMACGLGQFEIAFGGLVVMIPILIFLRYVPIFDMHQCLIKFNYTAKTVAPAPEAAVIVPVEGEPPAEAAPVTIAPAPSSPLNDSLIHQKYMLDVKKILETSLKQNRVRFDLTDVSSKNLRLTYRVRLSMEKAYIIAYKIVEANKQLIESFTIDLDDSD